MRDLTPRAHVVTLVDLDSVILLRTVDNGSVRYSAPGVAVRPGETPGKAAERAALEQLGLEVAVGELLYADTEHGTEHFFFLADHRESRDAVPAAGATVVGADEIVALRRAAVLGYPVEPRELARRLSEHRAESF